MDNFKDQVNNRLNYSGFIFTKIYLKNFIRDILKVLKTIKDFEIETKSQLNENLMNLVNSNHAKAAQQKNQNGQQTRNYNNNSNGLIDLAPLSFSKPDLLARLNDDWFQRTGSV